MGKKEKVRVDISGNVLRKEEKKGKRRKRDEKKGKRTKLILKKICESAGCAKQWNTSVMNV